jgi:hypothetical protein
MRRLLLVLGLMSFCFLPASGWAQAKSTSRSKSAVDPEKTGGPSLDETMAWTKGALATYGSNVSWTFVNTSGTTTTTVDQVLTSADDCSATIDRSTTRSTQTQSGLGTYAVRDTISLNLKDIDPGSGTASDSPAFSDQNSTTGYQGAVVSFQTTNLSQSIEVSSTTTNVSNGQLLLTSQANINETSVTLRVTNKDAADRLLKAISHAVLLCGGKKSTAF